MKPAGASRLAGERTDTRYRPGAAHLTLFIVTDRPTFRNQTSECADSGRRGPGPEAWLERPGSKSDASPTRRKSAPASQATVQRRNTSIPRPWGHVSPTWADASPAKAALILSLSHRSWEPTVHRPNGESSPLTGDDCRITPFANMA